MLASRSIAAIASRPALYSARRLVTTEVTRPEHTPAAVDSVSGAPEELTTERMVRIFAPAKPATQSGRNNTRTWRIDFDILPDADRWENPLIGWASSADTQQALQIKFLSKEEAISFAERQGWSYYVQEPKKAKFVKKAYADNFKYNPNKLRLIKTK
ncbi:potential mitochondrial complex 21_18kd subunit [Lichtheimia corymbifera JMRC:FSU:9682]|uniref:NADH dehydrogenase [ubiquinone] iron-sulfur protein 4, mitochondrial n=1 Tax=Lichtheimia corymbifera JMRC:FSU:9682 TaxID=1263082 RepID=A0A068RJT9_9FUNG|nr:potential mitochondrial complex 21_18kd subunit [Lichtheimia corymbifera JMRC:FSU:9682]